MTRKHKNLFFGIFIGIIISCFIVIFYLLGLFDYLEFKSLDTRFKFRGPTAPIDDIVIVAVDDPSFQEIGVYPWPRSVYAKVIDNLKRVGAKVIGVDIEFATPGLLGQKHDRNFASAAKKAGNVILVSTITKSGDTEHVKITNLNLPIEILKKNIAGHGISQFPLDKDGFIRRSNLTFEFLGVFYPAFGIEVLKHVEKWKGTTLDFLKYLKVPDDNILINYVSTAGSFPTKHFYQVYSNLLPMEKTFKDKIVLIGATSPVLQDIHQTPFDRSMSGIEIHANVIDTLMKRNYIYQLQPHINIMLIFVVSILVVFFVLRFGPLTSSILVGFELILLILITFYLFTVNRIWINLVGPVSGVLFTYTGLILFRYIIEGIEKRRIRMIFSRYVSKQVVNEILKNPDQIFLGGTRKPVTILFSDIRDFTSISEQFNPEQVVEMLNEYFTEMSNIILKYEGTIDKYIGDALMAVFGSPIGKSDDALRAVKSAVEMQEKAENLRKKWESEGKAQFYIGIGLNYGEAVIGNIGSPEKMEFTAIGDTVNVASRIESLTKEYKAQILISSSVYEQVKDIVDVIEIGEIFVKGKTKTFKIYKLLNLKNLFLH